MSTFTTVGVGRLTRDPEVQVTPQGITLAKFSVAIDRDFKPAGGEKQTDFVNCVAWRKTAEFVRDYVTKGRLVCCQGRMQSRKYTTQDGREVLVWEWVVDHIQLLDKRQEGDNGHGNGGGEEAPAAPAADDGDPFADE